MSSWPTTSYPAIRKGCLFLFSMQFFISNDAVSNGVLRNRLWLCTGNYVLSFPSTQTTPNCPKAPEVLAFSCGLEFFQFFSYDLKRIIRSCFWLFLAFSSDHRYWESLPQLYPLDSIIDECAEKLLEIWTEERLVRVCRSKNQEYFLELSPYCLRDN